MALIRCPECDSEISDSAIKCPKCGKQLRKPRRSVMGKIFLWIFYLFNAFMAWALVSGINAVSKDMGTPMSDAEMVGATIGTGLGIGMMLMLWAMGAVITGLLALMTRPKA